MAGAVMRTGEPLEDVHLSPPKWREVLLALLDWNNRSHGTLNKSVSYKTMHDRRQYFFLFFRELRKLGYWIDPRSLGTRHIKVMVAEWINRELAPATMQTYLSHLRVFAEWIGKPGLVPDLSKLTPTPGRFDRVYVAVKPKAWEAKDVEVAAIVARADAIDRYVGAQLRMQHAFGLRVKEAVLFQPHVSVVQREGQDFLIVKRGTKGGRERLIPVDSDVKRSALEHARLIAQSLQQSLADPNKSLLQAYRRFYYIMRLVGVTEGQLGVTAHGLRHGFAAAVYEKVAGVAPPVAGGDQVPRDADKSARQDVVEQLGHAREQIAGAYLGKRPRKGL